MKWTIIIIPLITCTLLFAAESESKRMVSNKYNDTTDVRFASAINRATKDSFLAASRYNLADLGVITTERKATSFILGYSKMDREIEAWYFPGKSDKRALIIAGVHGSELSALEIARELITMLKEGNQPYYSVVIVPTLFPDNASKAIMKPATINSVDNIGRYSYHGAVDPNRQMPSPGKPFIDSCAKDHVGRDIERENQLLLKLIRDFRPMRVANLHAIRNSKYGGVYADPRTDHEGYALGYETDSSLAVDMAKYIQGRGGNVAGNNLKKKPTALYYKDPIPAPAGMLQRRNMTGSILNANRGSGVSLGTWGATAVVAEDSALSRPAMRIITIEYPGCKRPIDYKTPAERQYHQRQVKTFAEALAVNFLGEGYVEGVD